MNLDYDGNTTIKLNRICPVLPNSCRQSVVANALNFYLKSDKFTPEDVIKDINAKRYKLGKTAFNSDIESLTDGEIDDFLAESGTGITSIRMAGIKYLETDLWKRILDKQFILIANHQLFYSDPIIQKENEIGFLPKDLYNRCVLEPKFSYQTFRDLYAFYMDRAGGIIEGHVDIVMDLKEIDGVISIVMANLVSVGNQKPVKLPFDFYRNYLALDWLQEKKITEVSQLPSEKDMSILRSFGFFDDKQFQFIFGQIEVYYPVDRRAELDKILL